MTDRTNVWMTSGLILTFNVSYKHRRDTNILNWLMQFSKMLFLTIIKCFITGLSNLLKYHLTNIKTRFYWSVFDGLIFFYFPVHLRYNKWWPEFQLYTYYYGIINIRGPPNCSCFESSTYNYVNLIWNPQIHKWFHNKTIRVLSVYVKEAGPLLLNSWLVRRDTGKRDKL